MPVSPIVLPHEPGPADGEGPGAVHQRAFARASAGGRVIALNTVWTLVGLVLPAALGLVALPMIVHAYGDERFAVLTLTWLVIGYFSIFDLGIGRAVTNRVAALLANRDMAAVEETVWTAWYLAALVGLAGGIAAAAATGPLLRHVVKVAGPLQHETRIVFLLLALGVPLIVCTAATRGVLEAAQRFGMVNAVRTPTGLLTFLIPLASIPFTHSLIPVTIGLVVVRVLGVVAYGGMCLWLLPTLRRRSRFNPAAAKSLFNFGAWLTVTNIVSPLMTAADRFVVSGAISVAALTYYATPLEAVSKVLLIPSAIAAVLFPAFSSFRREDDARVVKLCRLSFRVVMLLEVPVAFLVIWFAPELLGAWLGPRFAVQSSGVLRWLMFGVLANSVGQIVFAFVQGLGRSDLTAKLHVAEAPLYALALWVLLARFGIEGAAMAWSGRAALDAAGLIWVARRESGWSWRRFVPDGPVPVALLAMTALGAFSPPLAIKLAATAVFALTYGAACWSWGLRGRAGVTALFAAWRGAAA